MSGHYLLSALPKEFQDLLITHLDFHSLEANHFLYKQDESVSDDLFIVLEGQA